MLTAAALLIQMTGCFDVTYRYAEDAAHDWVFLAQRERIVAVSEGPEDGDTVGLLHYRVAGTALVAHWQEDWTPSLASWTRVVRGSDGTLQHSCTARFTQNAWRCATPATPKPFRDKARTDYQALDRDSVLQILPTGFVQSERNEKRTTDGVLVATEVGWNEYRRIADDQCPVVPTE